jgi:hypothetical protein
VERVTGLEPFLAPKQVVDSQATYKTETQASPSVSTQEDGTLWNALAEIVQVWPKLSIVNRSTLLNLVRALKGGQV